MPTKQLHSLIKVLSQMLNQNTDEKKKKCPQINELI